MATALTLFLSSTNDTLVTTARQLLSTAPAAEVSLAATGAIAKNAVGWIELASEGSTNVTLLSSEPAPSGLGFIWDVTTLVGQQTVAGTWTPSIKLSVAAGTPVADIHVRLFKYNAGVYTQLTSGGVATDCILAAQTISSTATVFTFAGTTLDATNFNTGDYLYADIILNITTGNANHTTEPITLYENGGAAEQTVTPGYQAQPVIVSGAASTTSTSSTTATASGAFSASASVSSLSTTTSVASQTQQASASISSTSTLSAIALQTQQVSAAISSSSTITSRRP